MLVSGEAEVGLKRSGGAMPVGVAKHSLLKKS